MITKIFILTHAALCILKFSFQEIEGQATKLEVEAPIMVCGVLQETYNRQQELNLRIIVPFAICSILQYHALNLIVVRV